MANKEIGIDRTCDKAVWYGDAASVETPRQGKYTYWASGKISEILDVNQMPGLCAKP